MKSTRALRWLLPATLLFTLGCSEPAPVLPGAGEWRLINYWAIWCAPCREEIPALNVVDKRDDVRVLGVNFDRKTGEALAEQSEALGIEFDALDFDPGEMLGVARPGALPITIVVSPEGEKVDVLLGPQTEATLVAAISR